MAANGGTADHAAPGTAVKDFKLQTTQFKLSDVITAYLTMTCHDMT